ncbi:MAG: FAD-dependent oxidoreductase [Anaerolineae bacterium]|nr:FAD-dependent oxidoreductase [Anaerolineae bacterium]
MTHTQYLIVGNGIAGITAAQEIRHADAEGRILIVSDEGEPYYYRASLSEWMAGETTDEMLPGRTPAFYETMRLEQIADRVLRVDAAVRQVTLESGAQIAYQKLLLATGARANTFAIEGLNQIHVYRTLADVRAIKERVGCCGRALILGGGILGLELAGALHKMGGKRIAVVHRPDHVGGPLLDRPAAEWLQARMRGDGIDLFLSDTVERVTGQAAQLKSGQRWTFDVLIESVGITPTSPQVEGLCVGQGIQIDEYGRTNLPDVYAAGDCTETRAPGSERWQTTRIWLDCARQGKTAGRHMAARNMAADGSSAPDQARPRAPFFNASLIYTVFYATIGEPHGEGGAVHLWQAGDGYRKIRVVDGKLAGALLLGERRGTMALLQATGQPVAQFGSRIAHPDFAFNELTGRDWDYMWY